MERAIEQAAIENVMKLTGMTCEDLEALKYLDKNDERVKTFQYSKDFAKAMEQAITIKTMQTIGMTEEEFLALEYLDENDERVKLFQNTKEAVRASFAKSFNNVIKANQSSA